MKIFCSILILMLMAAILIPAFNTYQYFLYFSAEEQEHKNFAARYLLHGDWPASVGNQFVENYLEYRIESPAGSAVSSFEASSQVSTKK